MKSIIKLSLLMPFKIIFFFYKLYEICLSFFVGREFASIGRTFLTKQNGELFQEINHVSSNNKKFKAIIYTPNHICVGRASTFSSKEPEMLRWIDEGQI